MRTSIKFMRPDSNWDEFPSPRSIPIEYGGLEVSDLPKYFWEDPEIEIDVYRACPEHKTRLDDELECSKGHKCKEWITMPRRLGMGVKWSRREPKPAPSAPSAENS